MNSTYIIGEIGQNHNGSVELAKVIIDLVARPVVNPMNGSALKAMDAIKLTKRDLKAELTQSMWEQKYDSPNSFGRTYGEHRAVLELNDAQHHEVYTYAKDKKLDFVETICAQGAMSLLKLFTPDKLKVASRDLTNLPLLEAMAETKIPIILSTGMADKNELDAAIGVISKFHNDISILHCVSEYPTHPENVNLNTIVYLKEYYSNYVIGFSDHTVGISAVVAAVALGAKIIEKHVTIDRRMKGTDQSNSLGPDGVNRMIRDIRFTEMSLGKKDIFLEPAVESAKLKLERSIASSRKILKGEVVTINDICLLSPGTGLRWSQNSDIVGKIARVDINEHELILKEHVVETE